MKLQLGNAACRVVHFNNVGEEQLLSKSLMVQAPGYKYMKAYKTGRWDGLIRFYHQNSRQFPSGFLSILAKDWQDKGLRIEVEDKRYPHGTVSEYVIPDQVRAKLRYYQEREVTSILNNSLVVGGKSFPWRRGVLKHPTGSGKSLVAIAIMETVNQPTLYLIERKRLLHQFAEQYEAFTGRTPGKVGDGILSLEKVTIVSVASLATRLDDPKVRDYLNTVKLIVCDETHHASRSRYTDIIKRCPVADMRLGMSGTPLSRGDIGDFTLIGTTGEMLSALDRAPLEAEGYLAKVKVKFLNMGYEGEFRGTYPQAYSALIVHNEERNRRIVSIASREVVDHQSKVLVLIRYIEHGEVLQSLFAEAGRIESIFLHGSISSDRQKQALTAFAQPGGLSIIIATAIMDEGVDIPVANVLINAASGMSEIKTIQRVGRIVRPKARSEFVKVYDFTDFGNEYLLKHSQARRRTYIQEKFHVLKSKTSVEV